MAGSVPTIDPELSLCLAPLAPWKRETWHTKVLLALPMKSAVFSRGTTLHLPNTQRMLYPPHNTTQSFSMCVRERLSPHHRGILQGRASARWLISSEDTPFFLFLPLILVLFCSPSSSFVWVHFIYHSFPKTMNPASSYTLAFTLYTITAPHPSLKCSVGTLEEPFMDGHSMWRSGVLYPWVNGCPPSRCCYRLVKQPHRVQILLTEDFSNQRF